MRKLLLLATASAMIAGLAGAPAAKADPWGYGPPVYRGGGYGYHGGGYGYRGYDRHRDRGFRGGDVLAGGVVGLAAGALLGSALSAPRAPTYYEPEPVYPAPVYREYVEPAPRPIYRPRVTRSYDAGYGRGHVEACFERYGSYDPRSDTFLGYDGYRHRCNL